MFSALPAEVQSELASLAEQFGQPLVHFAKLEVTELFDPLSSPDRYGEVCMVVQRPDGHLIAAKKTFYPANAYRLLTGGIHPGEPVLDALLRETHEETGLEVTVSRFLAAVAYHWPGQEDKPLFYTFAFLLAETGGTLASLDQDEHLEYFREIMPAELPERAAFLAHLSSDYSDSWGIEWVAWGRFRAVIHRLVWQALQ
ncbi:MAG TPA: NUDIX hydrolase [Ktedonobacteraceae bacterium]